MSIRIGNSCVNCENLSANEICKVHGVIVSTSYTCDSFEMIQIVLPVIVMNQSLVQIQKKRLKICCVLIGHLKMLKPNLIRLF